MEVRWVLLCCAVTSLDGCWVLHPPTPLTAARGVCRSSTLATPLAPATSLSARRSQPPSLALKSMTTTGVWGGVGLRAVCVVWGEKPNTTGILTPYTPTPTHPHTNPSPQPYP